MSKDDTDTHLRYGQGVLIKGFKESDDEGILTSRGFADTGAKYETVEDILYFKNYRNGIFQILPAGNFEISDELLKLEDQVTLTSEEQQKRTNMMNILRQRTTSEKIQFQLGIESKKKQTVKFGDLVVFKHIDSNTFLSGTIRPSDGTNGAFSVEVSRKLSSSVIFKLENYRSFQKEAMEIPYSSPILIKNKNNDGYLTFEKIGASNLGAEKKTYIEKIATQSDPSYRIPVKTLSQNSSIYEVVTHFADLSIKEETTPMPWHFKLHFQDVENDSLIQHDIVYLEHTENGGILSAAKDNEIILKESKEGNGGFEFYESLWQIEKHTATQNAYILRHLMSGMTLGINFSGDEEEKVPVTAALKDISGGTNLGFIEICLAKKQGEINSGGHIKLSWGNYTLDINEQPDEEEEMMEKSASRMSDLISKNKMKKLMEQQNEYIVRKLKFSQDISNHCFIIQEIEDDLKEQLLFALSFHTKIIGLREDLKWGATQAAKKVDYIRMMQMIEKIKQIKIFLKDCPPEKACRQQQLPQSNRQQICKDLGLSQLLFELLFFMKENMKEEIFKEKVNELQKFIELYNTCYEVIFELIRGNVAFKVHVSKWLIFVFDDVIQKNQPIHFKLLMEILNCNEFFVKNFVTEGLVDYLAEQMFSGIGGGNENKEKEKQKSDSKEKKIEFFQKKYIDIFRSFCIVNGNVVTKNQLILLNRFIKQMKENPKGEIFLIQFKLKEGEVYCYATVDKTKLDYYKFSDFKAKCFAEGEDGAKLNSLSWEYYTSYFNLLADMTQGRNKQTEQFMCEQLPLELLKVFIQTENLSDFQVPILRLIHYLHVQNEYFYPIEKEIRVISYKNISEREIRINQVVGKKFTPNEFFGNLLQIIILKLDDYGPIHPEKTDTNETLHALLLLVKETINMGFWSDKEYIVRILSNILNILEPPLDIDYEDYQICMRKYTLAIDCKNQCLKIINLIIDFDIDISLQILNKTFQQFQLPERSMKLDERFLDIQEDTEFANDFISAYKENHKNMATNIVDDSIQTKLLELSKYGNPELTSQSLFIMERIFNNERNEIKRFYDQVYICEEDQISLSEYLSASQEQFTLLENPQIQEISYDTQENNYFNIYRDGEGIMTTMYMINQLMKNEYSLTKRDQIPSLEDSKIFQNLGTDRLLNFTDERTSSCLKKQKLVCASNIQQKILTFITNCQEVPEEELALKLLHLSYRFIVGLIENHQEVKVVVEKHIPQIIHHIASNIGCIDFLKEIYDNNKIMLYNEVELHKLIRIVCQNVEANDGKFYKSKLLDFLRFIIYLNGKTIKKNQILILKIMQDDDFSKILIPVNADIIQELTEQYSTMNDFEKEVRMTPDMLYMVTYFQILTSLIDENNEVNMGKLVKEFPFQSLREFIKLSKDCWALKRNIRAFINRLYYFSTGTNAYINSIMKYDVPNMIQDLDCYIALKTDERNKSAKQNLTFENPVRFSYLQSYLFLNLEEILFSLYSIINTKDMFAQLEKYLKKEECIPFCLHFMKIAERISWLRGYFKTQKNVSTTSLIKLIQKRLRELFKQINIGAFREALENDEDAEEARAKIIQRISAGEIGKFYENGSKDYLSQVPLSFSVHLREEKREVQEFNKILFQDKMKEILCRKKKQFKTEDQQIGFKHYKISNGLKLDQKVLETFILNFNEKLGSFFEADEKAFFQSIASLIQIYIDEPQILSDRQKQFLLELVITIFEKQNKNQFQERKEIDEWEADDWKCSKEKIEELQSAFSQKCQLGSFITELIKGDMSNNIPLANSTLLCGIAYLLGGNTKIQQELRESFKCEGNRVLMNIKNLIVKLGKLIRQNISQLASQREEIHEDFQLTSVDNYDFYDAMEKKMDRKNVIEEHTTDEDIYYQQCVVTYRRAFKFLQLMCEQGNEVNKEFIRDQQDKSQSINFIQIATKEFRNILNVLCGNLAEVPGFILDFLLEVTQIPVKANQASLMNSPFFEDLCLFHKGFTLEKFQQRNFKNWDAIDDIYKKSVQIILSNFEGNDKQSFQRLNEKLQPDFLSNLLQNKLKSMNIKSKQQLIRKIQKQVSPQEGIFTEQIISLLQIMMIFMKFKDKMKNCNVLTQYNKLKKKTEANKKLLTFLQEKCLLKIEISSGINQETKKEERQNIYFPNHPSFNSLSKGLKTDIMKNVERSTHRDKIVTLLSYKHGLKEKILESYKLEKRDSITEENMTESYKKAAMVSVILCVYIFLFYDIYIQYGGAQYTSSWAIRAGRFLISLVNLWFSWNYVKYWYQLRVWYKAKPQPQEPAPEEEAAEEGNTEEQMLEGEGEEPEPVAESMSQKILRFIGIIISFITLLLSYVGLGGQEESSDEEEEQEKPQTFWRSSDFPRIAAFVLVSFLSTFVHPPLIFIHIIDIFCALPVLVSIFEAIAIGIPSLMYVSLMGVVFTFIFCTVTFSNYMKNVYEDPVLDEMCDGMISCIMALYVSGVIGETMEQFEITRFIFDMIYGIFFGMLFGNIVSGIILDAFGELRDINDSLDNDKENFCYICNISRDKLQKNSEKFGVHIKKNHYLWNYLFYVISLEMKDETEYTGLQYYIHNKYFKPDEEMDVGWLPNGEQAEFDCNNNVTDLTEQITNSEEKMGNKLLQLEQKILEFTDNVAKLEE